MKTTLNMDDLLVRAAKKRAVQEGKTLTRIIEEALRRYIQPQAGPTRPFRLRLLTRKGGLVPGIDLSDRDSLYERMEGRH
jgi:hypothetical protein